MSLNSFENLIKIWIFPRTLTYSFTQKFGQRSRLAQDSADTGRAEVFSALPKDNDIIIVTIVTTAIAGHHSATSMACALHVGFSLDPFGVGTTIVFLLHMVTEAYFSQKTAKSHLHNFPSSSVHLP